MDMKLSDKTIDLLENFSSINQSILVKKGTKLRTISVMKNILAEAEVDENFEKDFGIYDLPQFLNGVGLMNDPDIDLKHDSYMIIREGKTTKGIKFKNNVDIGDPVKMAEKYYKDGADEIVFYDITASNEKRNIMLDVVKRVAANIFIPFSVGGGISSVEDMRDVLLAGAEKVSVKLSRKK